MSVIEKAIDSLMPGEPVTHLNLSVFPLFGGDAGEPQYLTLDEALSRKLIEVAEVSESGHVPELKVINHADQPVLLLDGEELVGAKQNRVINLTVMVPAKTTLTLPVTCIEAGRWHHVSRKFKSSPRAVFAQLRASKFEDVTDSLRTSSKRSANQHRTWDAIREKMARMETPSETGAMADIFENYEDTLTGYTQAVTPRPNQVGAVFAINGKVCGMDTFDHPQTLARLLPKLVQSYALDAIDQARTAGQSQAAPAPTLAEFLKQLRTVAAEPYPAIGLGTDLRFEAEEVTGGALAVDEKVVHLCAFQRVGSGNGASTRRRATQQGIFE